MKIKYYIISIIFIFLVFIIKTLNDAGEFKSISPHFDGSCISIIGSVGSEDITILGNGLAIISSDDRRQTLAGKPVQGAIFSYDLTTDSPLLINLTKELNIDFHPHGISVYEKGGGAFVVAVVNHSINENSIEIFEYGDAGLIHEKTITDPLLISPNDLVFINETQLYITNDHGNSSRWGKTIEEYLQLARSNVLFYDGNELTTVIKQLRYSNGININGDGNVLYVAETVGKKISEYAIDKNSNTLTFIKSTYFNSGVDNIELDREGNLWIGSHPQLLTFTRHAKNSDIFSPSQVFKVSLGDKNRVDEVYINDGGKLSGSSVAAVWKNNLLIGPVLEDHFLHCLFE